MSNKNVTVPELAIDRILHPDGTMGARNRGERRAIAALIHHMSLTGWEVCEVYDGDDRTAVTDAKSAMELIFNLDDCYLYFCKGKAKRWARIVLGNSPDEVVCDYTCPEDGPQGFTASMESLKLEEYL